MRLIKIKLISKTDIVFDFIRFAEKNKISIYISYETEDVFNNLLFLYIGVPENSLSAFNAKYYKLIIQNENL